LKGNTNSSCLRYHRRPVVGGGRVIGKAFNPLPKGSHEVDMVLGVTCGRLSFDTKTSAC
jgi:hypothetical protein